MAPMIQGHWLRGIRLNPVGLSLVLMILASVAEAPARSPSPSAYATYRMTLYSRDGQSLPLERELLRVHPWQNSLHGERLGYYQWGDTGGQYRWMVDWSGVPHIRFDGHLESFGEGRLIDTDEGLGTDDSIEVIEFTFRDERGRQVKVAYTLDVEESSCHVPPFCG